MSVEERSVELQLQEPLVAPGHDYESVNGMISGVVLMRRTPVTWWLAFGGAFLLLMLFLVAVTWLFYKGVGVWGINIPIAWGFAIVNFVWWIGIGHAGTLISAILLLLKQEWRTSINRFAEAMTLFAVACAGMFPILHLGRPWLFYWLLPFPNTMQLWPQPRSPLIWDVFAVSTYATVSLLFWYVGLIPDLATMRDRARNLWVRRVYGIMSFGWRGAARHWHRYQMLYLLLAGLSTPLVLSVHSIVSFDFAVSVVPGWHTTIFPPYFVAGAIYSGFAMVLSLVIPLRRFYHLEDVITMRHIDTMAKVMLGTGWIVAYGYSMEIFISFYSSSGFEQYLTRNRFFGPYAPIYWALLLCNVFLPQAFWSGRVRHNVVLVWGLSMIVNTGMWLERFVIVVISLHRDFLPSSWGLYFPTVWDWSTYLGTIGVFLCLMFLFIRLLPAISMFEVRELVHRQQAGGH